jgi:hypothetical protein
MFFKEYFISVADCLEAQYLGIQRKGQNPSDKGELCEIFLKSLLNDLFSDLFKIYRGGKIINVEKKRIKQIIVLSAKNTIKIFGDKGIYPIESVYRVFSITATLDHPKLFSVIEEFKSIPKENPQFESINVLGFDEKEVLEKWNERFPFKCAFGFSGDINLSWEKELNEMVATDSNLKNYFPDLILVNKRGMITKVYPESAKTTDGSIISKDFHYTDFESYPNYGAPIIVVANELYYLSSWQRTVVPAYPAYFNKDLAYPDQPSHSIPAFYVPRIISARRRDRILRILANNGGKME